MSTRILGVVAALVLGGCFGDNAASSRDGGARDATIADAGDAGDAGMIAGDGRHDAAPDAARDAAPDAPPDAVPPDGPPACASPTCGTTSAVLCALGACCNVDVDCASNACDATTHVCIADPCQDHHRDGREADVDCGDGVCAKCGTGATCTADAQCQGGCDSIAHRCVAWSCRDHHQDVDETDVDCGGYLADCPECGLGKHCDTGLDVDSGYLCVAHVVVGYDCDDGLLDGGESDVDCGGTTCAGCADGRACTADGDCASRVCDAALGECVPSGCSDGRKDGAETAIDCGGGCLPCATGSPCGADRDCASSACDATSHACVASSCADHRLDGTEPDTDCGGACAACALWRACGGDDDCASGHCDPTAAVCVPAACANGVQDGNESAVDCGGECAPCGQGAACRIDQDCLTTACDAPSSTCVANQCVDHHVELGESDIDCGYFSACGACAIGKTCVLDADCTSSACHAPGVCGLPWCSDGVLDSGETDVDCGGGGCSGCPLGGHCELDYDCTSQACDFGTFVCIADPCFDHRQDRDETSTDCGGPTCAARCAGGGWCLADSDCQAGLTCAVTYPHICQ